MEEDDLPSSGGEGEEVENVRVLLVRDPQGRRVEAQDMEVVRTPLRLGEPEDPGTLLVRNLFISLDPYMRGRMNTSKASYFTPFKLGQVLEASTVAEVLRGNRDGIGPGDSVVVYFAGWEKYSLVGPTARVRKLDTSSPFSVSLHLGILGLTGATAYHGLSLCDPQPGQTLFVSAAAGAVGLAVGQMAKARGLRVIGSAGQEEKVRLLTDQFGFDAAFNYRDVHGRIQEKLQELAPEGLDCYFDNVGGEHLDAALGCMKSHGVVAACGMISVYNGESYAYKNLPAIIGKQLKVQGFVIGSQLRDPEFIGKFTADVGLWLAEGKLSAQEYVVEGIENAPGAFVGLFEGTNIGKLLVKV